MNCIDIDYVNAKDKALVERFINDTTCKRYILGINKLTKSVRKYVDVDGIIDDFTRVQRSRKKEILKIEEVPKGALILSVSTGSPLEVAKRLDTLGFEHINYLALHKYSDFDLVDPPFMVDFLDDYIHHKTAYENTFNLLADAQSKQVFEQLINFKISMDLNFMKGFTNNHSGQYFDLEVLPKFTNLRFVDGGGYVGDTASEVIKQYPNFEKIYLIEPLAENIRIAKRDLKAFENIEFFEVGLSKMKETLHFNEEKSFSTIYGKGNLTIEVDTLDNLIHEKVDFIKLDIEGAEQDAILGAVHTIEKYKPVLAICIYHKAEDWHKIAQIILEIEPNYQVYLRHYMEGIFETVMYFISK